MRLAATQDTRFRTELLVIALRSEADRRGPVGRRHDAGDEARLERLAAELEVVAPEDDDDLEHVAHHRTARNELARARGEATAADWAEAVRLWQADVRPREEAYCLLREAECHAAERRRAKAAAAASAARVIAERLGATPILAAVDDLLARTRLSVTPAPAAARRGPALRPDRPRARGAGAARHRRDQPADRQEAVHQRAHGGCPCVPCAA